METIGIEGIEIEKICGFGEERESPQKIIIDIEIETDVFEVAKHDDPDSGLDFDDLHGIVTLALDIEVYTLERIAVEVWKRLRNLKDAQRVRVKVRKKDPPLSGNVSSTCVEINE